MTEFNGGKTGTASKSAASIPAKDDLVRLTETVGRGEELPASSQDSILNAAHVFEAQLEQMSAWKHQLAQQMEIMRRDGIKLLERQKSLAVERKRLCDEREALVADRQEVERLHLEVGEENKRLRDKEAQIEAARAELHALDGERQRWERELATAQQASESLEHRRLETVSQLAEAEARLTEIQGLASQRDALLSDIDAARAKVAEIETQVSAAAASRDELSQREVEFAQRERALAERETRHLCENATLRESIEQLEEQRKQLVAAQGALLRESDVQSGKQDERWSALEARATELAAQEQSLAARTHEIAARDQQLREEKLRTENAQAELLAQHEQLIQAERSLAQRKLGVDDELEQRVAAAEKSKAEVEEERQSLMKQRHELEKKLDDMENELTSQLDMLGKQTKRLTERRADLETRSAGLEKDFEERLASETQSLRDELARTQRAYEQRATFLQQQIDQNNSGTKEWSEREAALRAELTASGEQLAAAKLELAHITADLAEANHDRGEHGFVLAAQLVRYEKDAAEWKQKLDEALAQNQNNSESEPNAAIVSTLKSELEQAVARLERTEGERKALEEQVAATGTAQVEGVKQAEALARQVNMFEQQRDDLAGQLFTVQDILRRQTDESLLAKNSLEGELFSLRRRYAELEAERTTWQSQQVGRLAEVSSEEVAQIRAAQEAVGAHRERLLRQARTLRAYRKQVRETQGTLEQSREEIAQQREQLRSRKENLEQVKRLLEKQEMVMARKLADHNALKTVAAVGIFVIMVLGSVFISVYKFVNPIYRSEAVVQLVPPPTVATAAPGPALQAWLTRQTEFIRSDDVTFTAWKMLRTPDEHYGMHDVREDWLASLGKNLSLQLDAGTKTLAVRYTGPNAEGVSQVCNAIANAYATPAARQNTPEQNREFGAGAAVLAKAMPPLYPAEDNRLMLSLSVVAIVMFLSLLLVMVFRHYVARQLREIDQMADEQDLDDIRAEMPAEVRPA